MLLYIPVHVHVQPRIKGASQGMLLYIVLKPAIMTITVLRDMKHVLNLPQSFETVGTCTVFTLVLTDYNWYVITMYLVGAFLTTWDPSEGRSSRIVFREWVSKSSC